MPQLTPPELYKQHYVDKTDERVDLFRKLAKQYEVRKALYAGSFVHIAPSFVIPCVVYVDSDRRFPGFFKQEQVAAYVESRKEYSEPTEIRSYHQNYDKQIDEPLESFDLLISQYAGFVSIACSKYLKTGGVLLANDSHGDASMANLDPQFRLIAVVDRKAERFKINEIGLHEYLKTRRPVEITRESLLRRGRGFGYSKPASFYVFRKIG